MKACDYCGKESEDVLTFCAECGTLLQPPPLPPELPLLLEPPLIVETPVAAPPIIYAPPSGPRVLNGGLATAVLGIYLGAQFAGGLLAGVYSAFIAGIQKGFYSHEHIKETLQEVMPVAILVVSVLGGIAVISTAKLFRFQLNDTNPTGPAWVRGSWRDIAKGLGAGILVAIGWLVLFNSWKHPPPEHDLGPMSRMSATPGFPQIAWVITALLFAPPIEELLFRGILYGGYRKSMGAAGAAALTTFIFVSMHFNELIYQPLAAIAITSLALVALALRLRCSAIGPSMAAHFGYNATIAVAVLYLT